MEEHRMYMIKGYLNILRTAYNAGRHVHEVAQCITVLQARLYLDKDIDPGYEGRIKKLIRKLYNDIGDYNGYSK